MTITQIVNSGTVTEPLDTALNAAPIAGIDVGSTVGAPMELIDPARPWLATPNFLDTFNLSSSDRPDFTTAPTATNRNGRAGTVGNCF